MDMPWIKRTFEMRHLEMKDALRFENPVHFQNRRLKILYVLKEMLGKYLVGRVRLKRPRIDRKVYADIRVTADVTIDVSFYLLVSTTKIQLHFITAS